MPSQQRARELRCTSRVKNVKSLDSPMSVGELLAERDAEVDRVVEEADAAADHREQDVARDAAEEPRVDERDAAQHRVGATGASPR